MPTRTLTTQPHAETVRPGDFEPIDHWYEKAFNATIHPLVNFFLNLEPGRLIQRYCHLHPRVDPEVLRELLEYQPRYFQWSGADLINVTTAGGKKQMVVIENNSCPSGQKSMPLSDEHQEQGGYRALIGHTFKGYAETTRPKIKGRLAVVYDKNYMEVSGYASAMADLFDEEILVAPFYLDDPDPPVRFNEGIMSVRDEQGRWQQVRAAFRYLTQKPWTRLPVQSKTRILNPIITCLAGGRNKMVASKAYDMFNAELDGTGLSILTPETIWDVSKNEVPLWVRKMGGQAVIKVPYSNAGQGVFTIVTEKELEDFMAMDFHYSRFIVQSLIGNYNWSSTTTIGKLYHVGTIPTLKNQTYVFDLRMMLGNTKQGLRPLVVYSRRARTPLINQVEAGDSSWAMLGTNLSFRTPEGEWATETNRLLLMDRRDFNRLGLGIDDLIEAFIQTVLSTVAIDKMSQTFFNSKGKFRMKLFKSLNDDDALINEIKVE
jgi:hypothetical protein